MSNDYSRSYPGKSPWGGPNISVTDYYAFHAGKKTMEEIINNPTPDADRQALRDDITARYENTLRSLDDGWQPIESAPDGVLVDLWVKCGLQETLRVQVGLPVASRETNCIRRNGQWYNDGADEPFRDELVTHWMPLPAPPQDKCAAALSDLAALDGETK